MAQPSLVNAIYRLRQPHRVTPNSKRDNALDRAFALVGEALSAKVAITVAGSAMFVLEGSLARDASDCDLVEINPPQHRGALDNAADFARQKLGLKANWLNDSMTTFDDFQSVPNNWESRTTVYGTFGNLEVRCMSRPDAITLKVATLHERGSREGYDKDVPDLEAISPTDSELEYAIRHLKAAEDTDYSQTVCGLIAMREDLKAKHKG
jgi:hypothetical protein